MNAKILSAFLVMLTMSGCIINSNHNPPPPPAPGDVAFTWSFDGRGCMDVPDVKSVQITIPGETLHNDGIYPCAANNVAGIILEDFAPGTYSYTVDAIDYSNQILFTKTGSFRVNGDIAVDVKLETLTGSNTYAHIYWSFPGGMSCLDSGVDEVHVYLNDVYVDTVACSVGMGGEGFVTDWMSAAQHKVGLVGTSQGYPLVESVGMIQTRVAQGVSADFTFYWVVGGAAVRYTLIDNSVIESCKDAGISYVYIDFMDSYGDMIYGSGGDRQPCNTSSAVAYNFLEPGTYKVFIQAAGDGASYFSVSNPAPTVTVTAGQFVTMNTATQPIAVYRSN